MFLTKLWAQLPAGRFALLLVFFILLASFFSVLISRDLQSLLLGHEPQYSSICVKDVNSLGNALEHRVKPLRVYMYDLPEKFNFGMLKHGRTARTPLLDQEFPPWPSGLGTRKQHSVEYWMMLYLLDTSNRQKTAIRVHDPKYADVFFVPFFSSLSFNTRGRRTLDPDTDGDHRLQIEILEFLHNSSWWQQSGGQDHILVMHHPNSLRYIREDLNSTTFIVADFGRYSQRVARLRKDVVAPYMHVVDTYVDDNFEDPFEARKILLFFRGTIRRKDDGIVRIKLAKLLENHSKVVYVNSTAKHGGIKQANSGMRRSRFCLIPAGDTPSSCRLFDAIVSHCVPVIVSDKLELPYETELNYEDFCLIFSADEALTPGHMIEILENFSKQRWLNMWKNLKLVSHHFEYQHPSLRDDATDMIWKQIQQKLPAIRLAKHRLRRLKIPDWWHW
ncbi:hypothetical protein KP509_22G010300 [Ceratopteris richardii]|uniref:Exostosin GT47 domain-containing protein n=1 Tax=Ceratopteris richardii TaxID=49495 RepID=A0A8T2S2M3_CERRI|nr:hypothetical protein KP509_22G010300 [Ceratopteris richardii]KAH7306416.1 hypothetical protein KP509_22G010300 [Ceratopteris richardii]